MAKPKKKGGPKQKLSAKAAAAKKVRDKKRAMRADRRVKKADSQKKHRDSPINKNKDYDHKSGTFKSVKANRGNDGMGTKREGNKNYKI